MNEVFVIADTHFGHRAIINFEAEKRPFATIEEHDEALVENWNKVVRKGDTVWHLGDVLFGAKAFGLIHRLNGVKKLVLGNHDLFPTARYLQYFNRVAGVMPYRDCVLSHIPVHPGQFGRYRLNVHGHLHSKKLDDPRYVCVSAEQTGLRPVLLESLIAIA